MQRKYSWVVGLALWGLLACCKTQQPTASITAPPSQPVAAPKAAAILTVILKAHYNAENKIVFEINSIIKKEGYLKNMPKHTAANYYKAVIAGRKGQAIDSCYFENPLNIQVEYGDDAGKLATAQLKSNEGYTSVRYNYVPGMELLNIYDNEGKKVSVLNVKEK